MTDEGGERAKRKARKMQQKTVKQEQFVIFWKHLCFSNKGAL
jgi:hypothetical protein